MTPRTDTFADGGHPYLMYKTPGGGLFDQGVRLAWDGSACLDCGHVMLFLKDAGLVEARQLTSFERR